MRLRATGFLAAVAMLVLAPAAAAESIDARLDGEYAMKGTITRADHVRGEHEGQQVKRTWRFTSKCTSGPCDSVVLHRQRSAGKVDRMILDKDAPGEYSGKGRFFFPIRCAGEVHKHGGEARVVIAVKITDATPIDGDLVATDLTGKYSNPKRINHTQCKGKTLGRDGARYTGTRIAT
jgi:hypothetical protein